MTTEVSTIGGVAGERLLSFIDRIERLEGEKTAITEDIKEVYSELKGVGFNVKVVRKIVSERKKDKETRAEQMELFDLYTSAIGFV